MEQSCCGAIQTTNPKLISVIKGCKWHALEGTNYKSMIEKRGLEMTPHVSRVSRDGVNYFNVHVHPGLPSAAVQGFVNQDEGLSKLVPQDLKDLISDNQVKWLNNTRRQS